MCRVCILKWWWMHRDTDTNRMDRWSSCTRGYTAYRLNLAHISYVTNANIVSSISSDSIQRNQQCFIFVRVAGFIFLLACLLVLSQSMALLGSYVVFFFNFVYKWNGWTAYNFPLLDIHNWSNSKRTYTHDGAGVRKASRYLICKRSKWDEVVEEWARRLMIKRASKSLLFDCVWCVYARYAVPSACKSATCDT